MLGIGGSVETYVLKNAELTFRKESGQISAPAFLSVKHLFSISEGCVSNRIVCSVKKP
jgi:hypothetical protein